LCLPGILKESHQIRIRLMPLSLIQQPTETYARPPARHVATLLGLWLVIFFAALFSPPLLDDADATHAQAARAMVTTGDWVTLHVNGIRYLEKPPLPYWLVAICFRIFGFNAFSVHLPSALAVLALAALGYCWARRAFDDRTAFYTALATLTCTGVFLFTRVFIPEVLLSLFLCIALYAFLGTTAELGAPCADSRTWARPYIMWTALALAVLTKGLVALVFFFGTAIVYLALTRQINHWRKLRPISGLTLFLLIAAPWHILASLRNTGGENGHGFFWFYFINEHVLRFLGRRIPRDYNKLPAALYWSLHLVWLFPWSLFAPLAAVLGWRRRNSLRTPAATRSGRTILLLTIYSALVLFFFSLSTNQEYYTFPVYLPLLMLMCAALARAERTPEPTLRRTLLAGHIAYTVIGIAAAIALAYGLWSARGLAFVPDIGELLAHRGVGDYTLSMSHFFDLTGPSFAALRLPAGIALFAFVVGPAAALILRNQRKHLASTVTVAITSAAFLIAAHIALNRFAPMLSSKKFADKIESLTDNQRIDRDTEILLFGDQSYGSSIPFYLNREVKLVDGRSSSMLFGSTFPDAPPVFITSSELLAEWGRGPRKILFIPEEKHGEANALLGQHQIVLAKTSGKILVTDRPLDTPNSAGAR
jgi:4-amino-4-deoxy-L-arabinose transferase-like glycosyltransferase